jgi:hypothetical protein
LNEVWTNALEEEAKPENERELSGGKFDVFPDHFMSTFDLYSFEGREDLKNQFRFLRPPRGIQPSNYGWVCDE